MSTINDTDLLLVKTGGGSYKIQCSELKDRIANDTLSGSHLLIANRNRTDYKVEVNELETRVQDDDWFLINQHSKDYKVTGKELLDYLLPADDPWDIRPRLHIVNYQNGPKGTWKVYGSDPSGKFARFYKYPQWELAYPGLPTYQSTGFDPNDFDPGQEFMVVAGTETKGDSFSAMCMGWGGTWDWGPDTDTTGLTSLRRFMKNIWEMKDMTWGGIWDTSQVTDWSELVARSPTWNGSLNHLDTSSANNFLGIFTDCPKFNQPLDNWDVSNVTVFTEAFYLAKEFDQDLSMWDTSSLVENNATPGVMGGANWMFYRAYAFKSDLSQWCVSGMPTEPDKFCEGNNLIPPVWGTCPRGEDTK